jgi:hypothetical protein
VLEPENLIVLSDLVISSLATQWTEGGQRPLEECIKPKFHSFAVMFYSTDISEEWQVRKTLGYILFDKCTLKELIRIISPRFSQAGRVRQAIEDVLYIITGSLKDRLEDLSISAQDGTALSTRGVVIVAAERRRC